MSATTYSPTIRLILEHLQSTFMKTTQSWLPFQNRLICPERIQILDCVIRAE
jgi:hypothetical protein